jgi:hypothetical protein
LKEKNIIFDLKDLQEEKSTTLKRQLTTTTEYGFSFELIENIELKDYGLKLLDFKKSVYNKELFIKIVDVLDDKGKNLEIQIRNITFRSILIVDTNYKAS